MRLIFILFYCLWSIKVSAVMLPEGQPDRTTVCARDNLQASCVGGEVIAIQSVNYGTKEATTCVLNDNSDACCVYDGVDCFLPTYTGTEQQAACSGKDLCSEVVIPQADTNSCGGNYPVLNHYVTVQHFCIQTSRILSMSGSSSLTTTGSLLYIQNQGYPNKIPASDTSGSCSVEIQDCSSRIKVYLVHFQLEGGGGSCIGTQQLQIDDDGTVQTLNCSDNTNFEITLKLTSTANYITVAFGNPSGVNDGYFWLGLEESTGSVPISVSCPAAARTMCMDCPSLTAPTNGDVSNPTTTYLSVAYYSCNTGYTLNGDTTRACDADGTWNGTEPTCQINECPSLSSPTNGVVSSPTITYQSEATYTCDTGYTLNGGATRVCGDDGTWNGSEPTCQINVCPSLIAPANGDVLHPSTTYLSVATYTCDTGYTLNGNTTRVCGATGSWNGSEPTCSSTGLGSSCTVDAECTTVISHSTCDGGVCSCADGYTKQNDECEETETKDPGLGSSCTVDAECTTVISHSTCDGGVCSCVDGYTQQNDECEEKETKDPEGLSIGAIIGIVIAVVVIVIAIIVLLFCCKKQDDREKISRLWQRIKDKLRSSGEVNVSLVHTPNEDIETKSSTPAPETDNAKNANMEQKLKDNDVQEKTESIKVKLEDEKKPVAPISPSDFREAHLLHSNLNDIPSPIPPSPAQLYPELSSASLFTGISLQLIEEYPLHHNIPPAATNDMTETMRVTPESQIDLQQASSESSLSGSVSLPVSVDVSSRQNGGSTVQARELTPVSSP